MKKNTLRITLLFISFLLANSSAFSQDLGATFCWQYQEIYGGHSYPYNKSIVTDNLPSTTTPKWVGMTQWWENMAEEIDYSGMDFIALLSRGNQPLAPDRGNGNPLHIPKMVNAMNARGTTNFKLAIFDDCPNSWTGSRNWNLSGGADYSTDTPKFDCANTNNYKYIWDYNLKEAIGHIPDSKRYKINNRMVIFFWSVKSAWMTNTQGNLTKIVQYIKNQCQTTYGFTPYVIVDESWFSSDTTLSGSGLVDAEHSWFSAAGGQSYTLTTRNNVKTGVCVPAFVKPSEPANGLLYPDMGTTDNGKRLKYGLDNTVDAAARTTLVEGFTNAAEGAALWRSKDSEYYDYPNQRLNILRRYTSNPYPATLKMEAEACDFNSDLTSANTGGTFLKTGNLDVEKCSDTNGGWNVTDTQANEWMEWRELPLLANTKFQLRYKSTATSSIKFSVDGTALSTITLPSTASVWTTIDAGNYSTASNSLHTVRLTIVSGTPEINYFLRVTGGVSVTSVTVTPATASIVDGNTQQLTATVAPTNATNDNVTWSSSNTAVATVNSSGLVTAIAPGTATITATTQDGNKTDTSVITVTAPVVANTIQTLQAENATLSGAIIANNQTGYNGTGFIDFVNNTGDYVQWTVNVPTAGSYDLSFRHSLLSGSRPLELKVNGVVKVASLDFPVTGSWSTWDKVTSTQTLNAGSNTIRLSTNGSNGGNIDELKVIPYFDNCDTTTGWSTAAANTLTSNTADEKQGLGCAQMVGSATEEFKKVFTPAYNSGTTIANGKLSFWYYVSDVTKCGTVRVELGSGGAADINELSWPLSGLVNGWNQISLNTADATQTGTPNMSALNWFRIFDTKTGSITTRIDAIEVINVSTSPSSQRKGVKTNNTVIEELSQEGMSIKIYPNPYHQGILSIDMTGFESMNEVKIKVTNLLGQVIYQENATDKSHQELNLSDKLSESIYFISVESADIKMVKRLIAK